MSLADNKCVPCRGGVPPLARDEAERMLAELDDGWQLNVAGHLERAYAFGNFAMAIAFANRVGAIAEEENHHPDLHVSWGRCAVEIWTHKISGLTESDFYFAAKTDRAREAFESELASA
ncbi:MAG TPA: 4a-hydroxytetrahydrobiopterin dehydratase [Gammaproteobacteria bacterium]|jgi:4a-hydroxytetrahydrobiopterin dehydratase